MTAPRHWTQGYDVGLSVPKPSYDERLQIEDDLESISDKSEYVRTPGQSLLHGIVANESRSGILRISTPTPARPSLPLNELPNEPPLPETTPARRRHAETSAQSTDEYADLEPHGLPAVSTLIDNHWVYIFFRFCAERHRMQDLRDSGVPRGELTTDETMRKERAGNVFRELDPGSKMMKTQIVGLGDQSHVEICCESRVLFPRNKCRGRPKT